MPSTTFRREIGRLKKGIAAAWAINVLVLMLTVEAAAIFIFLDPHSTGKEISSFLGVSVPVSAVIAVILTSLSAISASKVVMGAAGDGCERVSRGTLYSAVEECSIAAGIPMPEVYVARDAGVANAWAVSDSKGSRIVVTDMLLKMMTRSELTGVVAHEVGHIASGDSRAMTTLTGLTAMTGIVAGSVRRVFRSRGDGESRDNPAAVLLIVFAFFFLLLAPLMSRLSRMWMSRTRESDADMLSVKYTDNPDALLGALVKLDASDGIIDSGRAAALDEKAGYLAFHAPKLPGLSAGLSTHPPMGKRIRALQDVGGILPAGHHE